MPLNGNICAFRIHIACVIVCRGCDYCRHVIWNEGMTWWRHQMETFSALLALCFVRDGNPPVTGGFPSQRPVTRSFDVFFDLPWTNGWVNNRNADDLRHHSTHYDATLTNIWPFRIRIPCAIVCRGCDCCLHVIWNDGMNAPFDLLMHDSLKPADAFICQWNGLLLVNSVRATFFRGNINMYLHFMSFLHTEMP